jgi:choline-sulfatase
MMGSHKLLAKTVMYEESVRVPWLMRVPQLGRTQQVIENRVSHIDLVPTMLDLIGKPMEDRFPGHSLVPALKGGEAVEDHVYIEWNPDLRGSTPRTIRTVSKEDRDRAHRAYTHTAIAPDGWKLCLSDLDKSQLFNLNDDPWETTNLYYSGAHKDVITRLRGKIRSWRDRV